MPPHVYFSKITLQIKDKKYEKPFEEFAIEEVADVVPYFTITSTLLHLGKLAFYIQRREFSVALAWSTMTSLVLLLAPFFTKRLGKSIVYFMFTLCVLIMAGTYIQAW